MTQDDDQGVSEVEIEDSTHQLLESRISSPEPSTSAVELVNKQLTLQQPVFKWTQRTYVPNVFESVEYEFGKVQICQDVENNTLTPFEIFFSTTKFDILVQLIVSELMRYAHQNGREFSVEIDEMKAFLGLNLVMGYHTLPSLRDYWSTEPDMAVPFVANVMPRTRFE